MLCYPCAQQGRDTPAVALCHHCSTALCRDHAHIKPTPVKAERRNKTFTAVRWEVELPLPAQTALCDVCHGALHQADAA